MRHPPWLGACGTVATRGTLLGRAAAGGTTETVGGELNLEGSCRASSTAAAARAGARRRSGLARRDEQAEPRWRRCRDRRRPQERERVICARGRRRSPSVQRSGGEPDPVTPAGGTSRAARPCVRCGPAWTRALVVAAFADGGAFGLAEIEAHKRARAAGVARARERRGLRGARAAGAARPRRLRSVASKLRTTHNSRGHARGDRACTTCACWRSQAPGLQLQAGLLRRARGTAPAAGLAALKTSRNKTAVHVIAAGSASADARLNSSEPAPTRLS